MLLITFGQKMNNSNNKLAKTLLSLALGITLSACGGSDSTPTPTPTPAPTPTPTNTAPVISSVGMNAATSGTPYSYTLEYSDADSGDTLTATSTELPAWLTFDAATGILSGTPVTSDVATTSITLTVNDGTVDTEQTFDIVVSGAAAGVLDFENAADTYAINNFDGGESTVVDNPDTTGNSSAQVVKMIKNAGQPWGGSTVDLSTPSSIAAGSNTFKMKVWSQRVVPVLFKLEGMGAEETVNHTGNGWEELAYDFTLTAGTLSKITVIFENGTMGDGTDNWTFYYDDITTPAPVITAPTVFVESDTVAYDFETGSTNTSVVWTMFENGSNPALEFVGNPNPSDSNMSDMVAKFTAEIAGQPYAGTETKGSSPVFTMDAENSIVKIMVYKSVISDVGIKFSVGAAAQPEIKVANTKINEWEELTFDFSSRIGMAETINIDSVIVFPDFNARTVETVSYFDNIRFGKNQ